MDSIAHVDRRHPSCKVPIISPGDGSKVVKYYPLCLITIHTLISLPLFSITSTLVTLSASHQHLLHNRRCQNAFNPLTNHQPGYLSYNETLSNSPHKLPKIKSPGTHLIRLFFWLSHAPQAIQAFRALPGLTGPYFPDQREFQTMGKL